MRDALSRRGFLMQSMAATALAGMSGNWVLAVPDNSDEWAFPLLGDLHFDRLEHHDHEWLAREQPNDVAQVQNYSRITRELTPRLLERVREVSGQLAKAGTVTPFVMQLGDLLEGLCGTEQLAARQAREALDFLKETKITVPWVMTKGNHDVTGPGAAAIYDKVLVPFLAEQSQAKIARAAYSRKQGETLIVFYDAYDRGSLEWFTKLLDETTPRRLIVAVHPPVVPYNARSTWHIYSSPKQQAEREKFLSLLGRHRAIVLCGHLHKFSYLVRRTAEGKFVQLALSSVAANADGQPRDVLDGLKYYGPDLVDLEPRHSPTTVETRRATLSAEQPFIEHFEYADTWGHALVRVRGERMTVEVFRGFEQEPWKRLDLSQPLTQPQ